MSNSGPEVDARRVAQLIVEHSGGDRRGSGYRVTDTEVLTAAHVVADARKVSVVFNADLSEEWRDQEATVRLRGAGDVAVVTIAPPPGEQRVEPARFGRLDRRAAQVPCRMVGFPLFKLRSDPLVGVDTAVPAPYRDVHQADGTIPTLSNWREGTFEINVDAPAEDPDPLHSPWEGMSGAAVWCAGLIVGVVDRHYPNEGLGRLAGARVTQWYERLDDAQLSELRGLLGLPAQGDELHDAIAAAAAWRLAAASPGRTRRRLGTLDSEREDEIAGWFVNPPGWDEAVAALRDSGIVLLHGGAGGGRHTAAIRLLGEHGRRRPPIVQLSPEPDERDEPGAPVLDRADVEADGRLMLDLSAVDDQDQFAAIVREWPGFRATVRDRRAAIVIVPPAREERLLRHQLGAPVVLGRPNGEKVFEAHLRALGLHSDGSTPPELAEVLARGSMEDIAYLARLVSMAHERSVSPSFADWLDQALAAHSDRAPDVARQLAEHADGHARAMLLVSAMLEGRGPEDVFTAQQLLLHVLHVNNGLGRELERPGLCARLAEIGVEPDGRGGIQFATLNYAESVRKYFWTNFPGLRDAFCDWVIECGRRMDYTADQGEEFVRRYARECLRTGRPDDLIKTVEKWTFEEPVRSELGFSALEFGLADPGKGRVFRGKCYEWSRKPHLEWSLAYVVIAACVRTIAPKYPNQAIVRLHHLTKNRNDAVAESAREGLLTLTEDRRFLRRLLARLTDPVRGRLDDPRERELFLTVADACRLVATTGTGRPLIAEAIVRRQLADGWHAVLSWGREPEYGDYVWRWLDTYTASRQHDLLTVLVAACKGELGHLATLDGIGRRWLRGREAQADDAAARQTIRRLNSGIDEAWNATGVR